ncbi:hypothetical protein KGM_203645 [Danaus plexippus plexippus]|uniref:Uncharacterized protein n=1 Tax=Danaus plexippus plexippus TaxID=278856 RepID=A0A212EIR6_DANPL|nr:hypothetical protein KGM_203645 [Danaus plexippus plexippus]
MTLIDVSSVSSDARSLRPRLSSGIQFSEVGSARRDARRHTTRGKNYENGKTNADTVWCRVYYYCCRDWRRPRTEEPISILIKKAIKRSDEAPPTRNRDCLCEYELWTVDNWRVRRGLSVLIPQ